MKELAAYSLLCPAEIIGTGLDRKHSAQYIYIVCYISSYKDRDGNKTPIT